MNSEKTVLLGLFCPLKHAGLDLREGRRDRGSQGGVLRPGGLLTLDFSCPRPGGTNPARSRDRRQDARSSRAMAGWSAFRDGHRPSEVSEALSHLSSPSR